MTIPTKQIEFWLTGWSKTHTGGAKVTFTINEEDLAYFEAATIRKGNIAGQRYVGYLVQLQEDETPDPQSLAPALKPEPSWPSGSCGEAVRLCKNPAFQAWLKFEYKDSAEIFNNFEPERASALIICSICDISSRKELNSNPVARHKFITLIRDSFRAS
jgi:hypothetical protein